MHPPSDKPWLPLSLLCSACCLVLLVVPTPAWNPPQFLPSPTTTASSSSLVSGRLASPSSTATTKESSTTEAAAAATTTTNQQTSSTSRPLCRSNETHIAWIVYTDPAREDSRTCVYQNITEAQQEAYQFLRDNVMPFDRPFLETMGFHDNQNEDPDTQPLPDGLDQGMIGQTILYALKAKQEFPNTDALPKRIWQEYILNYANANEARTNWRPLLYEKLRHLVTPQMNVSNVVRTVNKQMWKILAPKGHDAIVFKSGSTPLIFDPMSILAFGYASCTGVSILLVNALRAVGVPARMVGTAAWCQDTAKGNHNWVEVWKNDQNDGNIHHGAWFFLEASPALGDGQVDDLERPPRQRWFCQPDRFGPYPQNTTLVYAARLIRGTGVSYPMAWEPENGDVPGEDVSAYYRQVCGVTLSPHAPDEV